MSSLLPNERKGDREMPIELAREIIPCFGMGCTRRGECEAYSLCERTDSFLRRDYCGRPTYAGLPEWRPMFIPRRGHSGESDL